MTSSRAIAIASAKHVGMTLAAGLFILAVMGACDAVGMWLQARKG